MPMTRRRTASLAALAVLSALAACAPGAPKGVNKDVLDEAVGSAVGDPGVCVMILDKTTGKRIWRYGSYLSCDRSLPSCEGGGAQTLDQVAAAALKGAEIAASCSSVADGSRGVGWVSGTAGDPSRNLVYAAVLESDRSLPGREMKLRLESAFKKAGL